MHLWFSLREESHQVKPDPELGTAQPQLYLFFFTKSPRRVCCRVQEIVHGLLSNENIRIPIKKQAKMCAEGSEGLFLYSKVFSIKESLVWHNRSPGQFGDRLVDQEDQIKLLMEKMLESSPPAVQGWKVRRSEKIWIQKNLFL